MALSLAGSESSSSSAELAAILDVLISIDDKTKAARIIVSDSNPSIPSGASTSILSANPAINFFFLKNNSPFNITINLSGDVLTSDMPSASNPCFVLAPGETYLSLGGLPTGSVTAYQASGSTIDALYVATA